MEERIPEIFHAEIRKRVHDSVAGAFDPGRTRAYLEALEEIARAAQTYLTNSTPTNAVGLDAALQRVDRMRV